MDDGQSLELTDLTGMRVQITRADSYVCLSFIHQSVYPPHFTYLQCLVLASHSRTFITSE